jgi:hypothetical protein
MEVADNLILARSFRGAAGRPRRDPDQEIETQPSAADLPPRAPSPQQIRTTAGEAARAIEKLTQEAIADGLTAGSALRAAPERARRDPDQGIEAQPVRRRPAHRAHRAPQQRDQANAGEAAEAIEKLTTTPTAWTAGSAASRSC